LRGYLHADLIPLGGILSTPFFLTLRGKQQ
jgi:hypothetical protein